MEADISIWRKTGHFYFALTEQGLSLAISGWDCWCEEDLSTPITIVRLGREAT
jgi:hypothetical protein